MGQKQPFIFPELLIHPGESLKELLEQKEISQKELAIRTGFSEKHISTVVHGTKDISSSFALKLGIALDTPPSFWKSLQNQYDLESESLKERNEISDEEIKVAKNLIKPLSKISKIEATSSDSQNVINLRQGLGVSNLLNIPLLKQSKPAYYRAQFKENTTDYLLYAWQYLIEKEVVHQTSNPFDYDLLLEKLPTLKQVMFEDSKDHFKLIQDILNDCGVLFSVKEAFKEAPLNGLTAKTTLNRLFISLTLKGKYIDIFFFTLFHEIAHIIYHDYLLSHDIELSQVDIEKRANEFAEDFLMDPEAYHEFTHQKQFTNEAILKFSRRLKIIPSILIGRLMNDNFIKWSDHPLRIKYQ